MKGIRKFCLLGLSIILAIAIEGGQAQSPEPDAKQADSSATVTGNLPWKTAVLDSIASGSTGQHVSLAISPITALAYISYYDVTHHDLRLARQTTPGTGNCGPANAWYCITVDNDGDVGQYSSIDVVRISGSLNSYDKIGISYYDATNKKLKYAAFACPAGCLWTIYTVDSSTDSGDDVGKYSAIKFSSDGTPNIAYHYFDDYDGGLNYPHWLIRYAYFQGTNAGNCGDSNQWRCVTIESEIAPSNTYISLDLDYQGKAFIAYYSGYLHYAYYKGLGGSCSDTSWECITIDNGPGGSDVGRFASLHAPDSPTDTLQVAYYDSTNGKIRYARQIGSGGNCASSAFECYAVDTVGASLTQMGLSLSVDATGAPIIAYMDASDEFSASSLKVARPASRMGQPIGNCGNVPPGYLFNYWWCQTVDPGYADLVGEAEYAAVGVGPNGLATVAYYEDDTYYTEGRLKVAWQSFPLYLPLLKK